MPAILAAIAALAATSCAAGLDAATLSQYTPAAGVNIREGDVHVLNLAVVSNGDDAAVLIAGLVNQVDDADALAEVEITTETGEEITVELPSEVELLNQDLVLLTDLDEPVTISGELRAGFTVQVMLTFENADAITVQAPVLCPDGDFADVEVPGSASTPAGPCADDADAEGSGGDEAGTSDSPSEPDETPADLPPATSPFGTPAVPAAPGG